MRLQQTSKGKICRSERKRRMTSTKNTSFAQVAETDRIGIEPQL
jgi:hypothetical protein